LKNIKPVDGWIIFNWSIQLAFNLAIWFFIGPKALMFMLISFFFSVGLHPLGARWIQEHYLVLDEVQETYSYYGPLNAVAFNVGYHNEHHDFPSIPWNKLPQLRKEAPEFYYSLKSHQSWFKLFFRFLFDNNVTLHSRVLREEKSKEKVYSPEEQEIKYF
jgi:sphingolipid delta-4 desaturase